MAKAKGNRVVITLSCMGCQSKGFGSHRYTTTKNRKNTPGRLELKKYCPVCKSHNIYKEIK